MDQVCAVQRQSNYEIATRGREGPTAGTNQLRITAISRGNGEVDNGVLEIGGGSVDGRCDGKDIGCGAFQGKMVFRNCRSQWRTVVADADIQKSSKDEEENEDSDCDADWTPNKGCKNLYKRKPWAVSKSLLGNAEDVHGETVLDDD